MAKKREISDLKLQQRIGWKINIERAARKMTQIELEALSGVPRITISRIEKGHHLPDVLTLLKLSKALNLSIDYLAGIIDHNFSPYLEFNRDWLALPLDAPLPKERVELVSFVRFLLTEEPEARQSMLTFLKANRTKF